LIPAVLLLALVSSPLGCRTNTRTPHTRFDGEQALQLVSEQIAFGFRPAGSHSGRATADWIAEKLRSHGWEVEAQEFTYRGVRCQNIIGRSPASTGEPVVLLGAHYDTRLRADRDPEHPEQPVMGANDGASGTAVLLELAEVLEAEKTAYQVWLAFFDAEDNGGIEGWEWIVGSSYMASRLTIRPEFVIVVDMVGDADQQIYYEHNSDPALMRAIWQVAAQLGYGDAIIPEYRHSMIDDHTPFADLGIPAVDMIDFDYPYWHTANDTLDRVNAASLERVGRTLETFLESGNLIEGSPAQHP